MIIRCLDFETTGLPPGAGVCEAGWTDIEVAVDGAVSMSSTYAELCNPGMPIGEEAGAVHGITDAMVATAPSSALVFRKIMEGADVLCAHNAEFEQLFFAGGELPWLCTYKVALVLHPDLPSHRNGTIPEHLEIVLDPECCAPLHRAGPDTYVTAMILQHFLANGSTVADMVAISKKPRQISRMPFGKHKGVWIKDLPLSYMKWAAENMDAADVRNAIKRELKARAAA